MTNHVVSAKKRKTMESVSTSEAPLNTEDTEMVPESQGQVSIPTCIHDASTDSTLRQVTTAHKMRVNASELVCVNTDTYSSVVACRRVSVNLFLACQLLACSMKTVLGWSLLWITLCFLISGCNAMSSSHVNSMSFYVLNANRMVNAGKLSQISSTIRIQRPLQKQRPQIRQQTTH